MSLRGLLDAHADLFDAVEWTYFWTKVTNFNARAARWAQAHGKPLVGNSDLHDLRQLGRTYYADRGRAARRRHLPGDSRWVGDPRNLPGAGGRTDQGGVGDDPSRPESAGYGLRAGAARDDVGGSIVCRGAVFTLLSTPPLSRRFRPIGAMFDTLS